MALTIAFLAGCAYLPLVGLGAMLLYVITSADARRGGQPRSAKRQPANNQKEKAP